MFAMKFATEFKKKSTRPDCCPDECTNRGM